MAVEEDDADTVADVEAEIAALESQLAKLEFRRMFSGEMDPNNAYLDIQSGSGGTEAQDWAEMLLRMYLRWADDKGFKAELVECSAGDDNIEIDINPSDVRTDTYRASGAGGQHINKTDSAVRLTHGPSGIVVQSQSQRSQHQNRDKCWQMLRAKLYELEVSKRQEAAQATEDTKSDIGWGSQIRSYVLDDARIKDLRTGVETRNTGAVLDGKLDQFIVASLKAGL
jgi:peptide chain release factor 2